MNKRRSTVSTKRATLASKPKAGSSRRSEPKQARGFDAGRMGRRLKAIPASRTAINTLIRAYGGNVLARSRYLCANNAYAMSAKEEFIAYMAGTGITPSSLVKGNDELKQAIQDTFDLWTDEADADSITDFYGMQALIAGELFEAGEVFIRFRERYLSDGFTVPLQLQLLPAEMLDTAYNIILGDGRRIECGIQFDQIGRREGYWFFVNHPGEFFQPNPLSGTFARTFVPASEVIHCYRPLRAGQIRGVPQTLAGMITLAMLDLYDDAELERKRLAALFGAFVTKGLSTADDGDANPLASAPTSPHHGPGATGSGTVDFSLEPGATVELDYGQDIKFSEPADVGGNYEAFQKRTLLRAAAGFGSTYHGLTGDTGGASYSSMRADQLRYRRRIEPQQHHILIHQFCRQVFMRWMDAAVLAGAIEGMSARDYAATPKLFQRAKWTPPKWEWVDPLKDISAEKLAVDSGFKSRDDVIVQQGEDPDTVDDRIEAGQMRAKRKGLRFITTRTGVQVSPTDDVEDLTPSQGGPVADPGNDPNANPNEPAPGKKQPAPGKKPPQKLNKRK